MIKVSATVAEWLTGKIMETDCHSTSEKRAFIGSAGFIAQRSGDRDFFYILQEGNTGLEGNVIYEWRECAVIGVR